jgi:hypothetical protein
MEAICSSETLVLTNNPSRRHKPEDQNPQKFSFLEYCPEGDKFKNCNNAFIEEFSQDKLPVKSVIYLALYQFRLNVRINQENILTPIIITIMTKIMIAVMKLPHEWRTEILIPIFKRGNIIEE